MNLQYYYLNLNRILNRHTYTIDIDVDDSLWIVMADGTRLLYSDKLNSITGIISGAGDYEPSERAIVSDIIKDGDVIIDIGANVGIYAIGIARECPTAMIYAFEPVADTYKELHANIAANRVFKNILPIQSAVSDHTGITRITTNLHASNYITPKDDSSGIEIICTTLDDFASSRKFVHVDFIKIDVEGHEYEALQGAVKTISKFKPVLMIEIIEDQTPFENRKTTAPCEILKYMAELGYSWERIDDDIKQSYHNYLFTPTG